MPMDIDFTESREIREVHPEGWFEAKCSDVKVESKGDGRVVATFTLNTAGGSIFNHCAVGSKDNNSFLLRQLSGLGFNDLQGKRVKFEFTKCLGKVCVVKIMHKPDTFEGRQFTRANIVRIEAVGSPELESVEVVKLGQKFVDRGPASTSSGVGNGANTGGAVEYDTDSDIPF